MPLLVIKAYKCNFCHRHFGRLCDANRHEEACANNPARRQCKTCIHGVIDVVGTEEGIFGDTSCIYDFVCNYHNVPFSDKPYFIECDINEDGYGPTEPIPGTCMAYEYKGKAGWTQASAGGD